MRSSFANAHILSRPVAAVIGGGRRRRPPVRWHHRRFHFRATGWTDGRAHRHRVRRKHLELAEQGKPANHLGWGVRNETERELVREAAGRVLAGQGLISIARDWNRRGVPGTTASPYGAEVAEDPPLGAHRRPAGARYSVVAASCAGVNPLATADHCLEDAHGVLTRDRLGQRVMSTTTSRSSLV